MSGKYDFTVLMFNALTMSTQYHRTLEWMSLKWYYDENRIFPIEAI